MDRWAGQGIEATIGAHHRRRLRRLGYLYQLEPPADGSLWAAGASPPREGCALEVLIDGVEALPRIAEALGAGALARAHSRLAHHP